MNKRLLKILTLLLVFSVHTSILHAQSWQWAKRGGSNIKGDGIDDLISNVVIDGNGNSYALAKVYSLPLSARIDIDGHSLGGGFGEEDVCLFSFDCAGNLRWVKMMGGGHGDDPGDIGIDTAGGVYVTCMLYADNAHDSFSISDDTVVRAPLVAPYVINKGFVIVKYDTSGVLQWMRMPEPDTLSVSGHGSGSFCMNVSEDGILSLLTLAGSSGAFAGGGYVIPATATLPALHMLQYDAKGNFIKGFPMQISEGDNVTMAQLNMSWDKKANAFYILSTEGGLPGRTMPKFGTTKMTGTVCLAKFNSSGSCGWVQQSSILTYANPWNNRPVLDKDGYIYIGFTIPPGETFGSYTFTNTLSARQNAALLKIDPRSGAVVWGYNVNADKGVGAGNVAVNNRGQVALCGNGPGTIQCGPYTAKAPFGADLVTAFMVILNTADGSVAGFDTVGASTTVPTIMTVDNHGNFYMAGTIGAAVEVPGCGTLYKAGGNTDFFLFKYGAADCRDPAPASIPGENLATQVKAYPNPVQNYLYLEGLESGTELTVFNHLGQRISCQTVAANAVSLPFYNYAPGIYIVRFTDKNGQSTSYKVCKQ